MTPPETTDAAASAGYERRDVRISALIWLGMTVLLSTAAVFIVLWLLLTFYERQAAKADPQLSPRAETAPAPPTPHLQEMPVEDLQALQRRDDAILTTYGWADQEQQTVRIPVSRAMDLALERGLPQPAPQETQGPPADEKRSP